LLIFSIIIVMAALAYLISGLIPDLSEARRERKSQEALAQARDALIGYALKYREDQRAQGQPGQVYGYLPLPDLGSTRNQNLGCTNEGCDAANFAGNALNTTVIGRLPWRTLGIGPLRDGQGECLWYAVSGSHQRIQQVAPMNWDTLGQLDVVVANSSAALVSALANAHERPVVVIFSAGPPLPGQNRSPPPSPPPAGDDVTECGGNYNVANYLDPSVPAALGGVTNYLAGTNSASGVTGDSDPDNDPDAPKALSPRGKVFDSGGSFLPHACQGANCNLVANDKGLELTGDALFGAIRKHAYFRTDINSLLDRMTDCLRDEIAAGAGPAGYAKIAGADNNACYGSGIVPLGYYPHYRDQVFIARGAMSVNGVINCPAALAFANQRGAGQFRQSLVNRSAAANYLESINLTSFTGAGTLFSGQEQFERVSSTQTISQDIARCVPSSASFVTTQSPGLIAAGLPQLANYSPTTRTLTLGQPIVGSALNASVSNFLYGCAWRPETHTLGSGLRSYFTFRIDDAGGATWPTLGFTFTLADGDNNGTDACGAAAQHLGYSGNNTESPFIAPPKVAFEVDLRREMGFNPSAADHLLNGRNDPPSPSYRGGHVAISYWGGETAINTTVLSIPPCTPPAFDFGGTCYLPQEEDDNVHAQPPFARTGFPAPPQNPAVPATELAVPPDSPAGAYKLDPTLTSTPVSPNFFHVRTELTRTSYVRVATAANLDLNAPGNPVNGVTLFAGDRVWVRYQTVSSENGLYVWNGAATPMTRTADGESASNFSLPRVRVATTGNINVNSASDPIIVDGVYLFDGDRILVKNQTAPSENGVYYWKAAENRLIRADDANSAAELAGMVVEVRQGALNAGSIWRQNTTNLVVDATALGWSNIRVKLAAPASTILASPGAELDGIRMKSGDRVFVRNNGVYIWNGAAVPMTAALDIVVGSSIVQIQQGSEANAWWLINGASSQRLASVRVATRKPIGEPGPDWNNPGSQIDSVGMLVGDRVLVKDESDASKNGIYVWNGAAVAMTRATDADASGELAGALVQVLEGSNVGRAFRQTTIAAAGTIDASPVQWAALDRSTSYLLEIWILLDSPSTDKIAAMKDTTRAMSLLYPGFTPHLQDRPVIPYSFRNARPGFTIGQRTSINDQTVLINNSFTTWLE
jgi:type II secretory pathway pseudopilin PulG